MKLVSTSALAFVFGMVVCLPIVQAQQTVDQNDVVYTSVNTQRLWRNTDQLPNGLEQDRIVFARAYRTVAINMGIMEQVVAQTTRPVADDERKVITLMFLPLPDGSNQQFEIWNDPVMHPELAARYPEIQTYTGRGVDDPTATVRMDKTPQGVHAQILRPSGTVFIDPYAVGNDEYYLSYFRKDFERHPLKSFTCGDATGTGQSPPDISLPAGIQNSGDELRTYRLAIACTGEYAAFHGATVSGALAAMATTMNRINGVYERDFSVRMELIANNDQLVFLNGDSDPYTNSSGFAMLGQNQETIDNIIGSASYDIGHVFSTGGGGVASLGSVCSGGSKAQGVTGGFAPVGDPFDIDYVAHEIGHQFRGEHSWNFCGSPSGTGSTDFEPGSGSTIMGYAGICGGDDYASNSDDYFHGANVVQMLNFIQTGDGSGCGVLTSTSNTAPEIIAMPAAMSIPISTPFELTAAATDSEGDPLTYCWEQMDGLNNISLLANPSGTFGSPLFRSFSPVESGTRTFPSMNLLVNNSTSRVELLPDYDRTMKFQVNVRDNHPGSGGVTWDNVTITVDETGGPFFITEPVGPTVVWEAGNWYPVNWEVGQTQNPPFNCATVRIELSDDGGYNYPITLHESVPNNGSNYIFAPNMPGDDFRIKVACNENIFFQISNGDLRIENNGMPSGLSEPGLQPLQILPNPASDWVQLTALNGQSMRDASLRVSDMTGRTMLAQTWPGEGPSSSLQLDVRSWSPGIYLLELRYADGRNGSQKLVVE